MCAAVEASGGQDALLKDHAKNLYKQSSSRNGSPAKNWVSHQPQQTTHTQHKNKQTGAGDKVRKHHKHAHK